MKVYRNLSTLPEFKKAVLTIGTFDGVHLGHQQILKQLLQESGACGGETVLITFYPHPRHLLYPEQPLFELTTLEERIRLLAAYGLHNLVVVPFTKAFSELSAEDYIKDFLVATFHPHAIIIGYDHKFGNNREGDFRLLEKFADAYQYRVQEISEQLINDSIISSTRIRLALSEGKIESANALLGHPFFFSGLVIPGNQLGRTIGFPTANLQVNHPEKLIPGEGVYAVTARLEGSEQKFRGMMNIGKRPTIDGTMKMIEVHLFDFNQDIYNRHLTIWVHHYLRAEKKFNDLNELKQQLSADRAAAQKLFTP
jgi:riboflavin kinase/FMN adenylyltransferase